MTEQQFAYWLQGFAELSGDTPPTVAQWKSIREHLALCFVKMTPSMVTGPHIIGPAVAGNGDSAKEIFEKYIIGKPVDEWTTMGLQGMGSVASAIC